MAEAHAAVAFRFEVHHDGVYFDYNQELLHTIYASIVRSYKRQIHRYRNNFRADVYPIPPISLWLWQGLVLSTSFANVDLTLGSSAYLQNFTFGPTFLSKLFWTSICGFATWFAFVQVVRNSLKFLLSYKGWMYERLGKPSLITKTWAVVVKTMIGSPRLYSLQGSIPKLPLPSLDGTIERWLRSVKPLYDEEQFHRMERLSEDFKKGIGPKLQRYLMLKSWFSTNYVTDWWEEYIYLRGRSPIMVNSNYYGVDTFYLQGTTIQAARAASLTYAALLYRRMLERQDLKPILAGGIYPLCSYQYERTFNTTRTPGIETDKLKHFNDSRHIVVFSNGCWYKLPIHNGKRLLTPAELEYNYTKILQSDEKPSRGEQFIGSLTAADRITWARARIDYFKSGVNKGSLDLIERAAFVVILDDEEVYFDENDPSKLDHWAALLLHGKGFDRWFDKSVNFIVFRNGRAGLNAEHSWADAPVVSQMFEVCIAMYLKDEELRADSSSSGLIFHHSMRDVHQMGFTEDGHTVGFKKLEQETTRPPPATKLKWDLSDECISVIQKCKESAEVLLNDVELRLLVFKTYGKGFMKKCGVSPDGYIQMALQLAYYRDQKKFCLTYEASMTRLYRDGRTETVRSATVESCAFVRAMEDPNVTNTERIELLKKSCVNHQNLYRDAMCGKGVDRHLFCLYVVSKYLEVESPFLKEILSEPWRLSTSQTPNQQTDLLDLRKHPEFNSAGGGFGPVADDGYGVSYVIGGEDMVSFHVSSKRSCPTTSSTRFREQIRQALLDMQKIFGDKTPASVPTKEVVLEKIPAAPSSAHQESGGGKTGNKIEEMGPLGNEKEDEELAEAVALEEAALELKEALKDTIVDSQKDCELSAKDSGISVSSSTESSSINNGDHEQ